jgi:molybdate transport system substrate-binding protein
MIQPPPALSIGATIPVCYWTTASGSPPEADMTICPVEHRSWISGLGLLILILLAAANISPARADYIVAPDVVVFCEPAVRHAIADVALLWRRQTGVPVRVFTSPTPLLLEQLSHRIRSDLIVGESDAMAAAAVRRRLVKEIPFRAWRNRLVVAEPATGPQPARDLATLIKTGPIALVDAPMAAAGVDSRKALQTLGLWDAAQGHSVGVAGTDDAIFLLVGGKARLAVIDATDLAANPGLHLAGSFPDDSYPPIIYWIAQTTAVLSPNAEKFESFLRQPEAQERLRADGLEVLP